MINKRYIVMLNRPGRRERKDRDDTTTNSFGTIA